MSLINVDAGMDLQQMWDKDHHITIVGKLMIKETTTTITRVPIIQINLASDAIGKIIHLAITKITIIAIHSTLVHQLTMAPIMRIPMWEALEIMDQDQDKAREW